MTRIHPLSLADAPEVLEFERANRAFFARSIPDRGDEFFATFDVRVTHLLAEQEAGRDRFFVIRDENDQLVGRINLIDIADGVGHVGYRVAEHANGRGHARAALRLLQAEAVRLGLERLRAMTTLDNLASRKVLESAGFTEAPGEPAQVAGHGGMLKPAVHYEWRPGRTPPTPPCRPR